MGRVYLATSRLVCLVLHRDRDLVNTWSAAIVLLLLDGTIGFALHWIKYNSFLVSIRIFIFAKMHLHFAFIVCVCWFYEFGVSEFGGLLFALGWSRDFGLFLFLVLFFVFG